MSCKQHEPCFNAPVKRKQGGFAMYFACNMPHYSPYELVNPAKIAAVAGFLPSYLDFSDRLLEEQLRVDLVREVSKE